MGADRWIASVLGYLASSFAVATAIFLFGLLALSAETGSFESGLAGGTGITLFGFLFLASGIAILPIWLAIALYSERKARRGLVWHVGMAVAGAAAMMAATLIATFDSAYYAETGHWFAAFGVFLTAVLAGALGGFAYWLAAGRNAGGQA